jgi:hypothetical protein
VSAGALGEDLPLVRALTYSARFGCFRGKGSCYQAMSRFDSAVGLWIFWDELMARVWPNTFVVQANLTVHVSALRRALRDGIGGNRYFVNVPNRGYYFVAPVVLEGSVGPRVSLHVASPSSLTS